jgi:hypothetical protein
MFSLLSLQILAVTKWILTLMLAIQPKAPWLATYEKTADALATASVEHPLFEGEDGRKTAAILMSLAWFEGNFKQDAQGDCGLGKTDAKTGMCVKDARPHSFCTFQINESNFTRFGVKKADILSDINLCTRTALKIVQESFRNCRALPVEDRLNFYVAGKDCTTGAKKGRHRVNYGLSLYKRSPNIPDVQDIFLTEEGKRVWPKEEYPSLVAAQ